MDTDPRLSFIKNRLFRPYAWLPSNHLEWHHSTQDAIFTLLLCCSREDNYMRLPKEILFLICAFIAENDPLPPPCSDMNPVMCQRKGCAEMFDPSLGPFCEFDCAYCGYDLCVKHRFLVKCQDENCDDYYCDKTMLHCDSCERPSCECCIVINSEGLPFCKDCSQPMCGFCGCQKRYCDCLKEFEYSIDP